MTTEEKLQHFLEFCMEDSRARSARMLDDCTAALEKSFEEHKAEAEHRAAMQLQFEKDRIRRDINKQLAMEQLKIKRELSQRQDELKDMLFVELRNRLASFMETPEYQHMLEKQIKEAAELAGSEPLTVYLDPADEDKLRRIALHAGKKADVRLSQYSFGGGSRAVIQSKNILIDNSFNSLIGEAKRHFTFHPAGKGGSGHD